VGQVFWLEYCTGEEGLCYNSTELNRVSTSYTSSIGEVLFPERFANANKRYTVNKYPEANIKIIIAVLT
jgi:hypothetical protein